MTLQALYDFLISEGCTQFYIDGIGGPQSDCVDHLSNNNGTWEVYFSERGQKVQVLFSSTQQTEAIDYYRQHILAMEHWHLIVFTASQEVFTNYQQALTAQSIRTIQNDIPHYSMPNDHVYRLFVVNKGIFQARDLFPELPYIDEKLRYKPS